MSKQEFDDGFHCVKAKRSSRKLHRKLRGESYITDSGDVEINVEKSIKKILLAQDELRQSEYLISFLGAVSNCLEANLAAEIVCLGLGHIAECKIALYQLALLLCLRDALKTKVLVHDPIFHKRDCEILHKLGITIIAENEEGKYQIAEEGFTIAYFPHCPKQLTNNFLWSNWGERLKHCILICNSFTRLIDDNPDRVVSRAVPFIFKLYPYTKEVSLENNFKFTDIFNDTSVHIFPEDKVRDLPSDYWNKGESPKYEDTTEFITSLVIEKLHL